MIYAPSQPHPSALCPASGTVLPYAPMRLLRHARYCPSACYYAPMRLLRHAQYCTSVCCLNRIRGRSVCFRTDLAYGLVLTWRTVPVSWY
eukprot:1909356-Rhodomonas_salina.1